MTSKQRSTYQSIPHIQLPIVYQK